MNVDYLSNTAKLIYTVLAGFRYRRGALGLCMQVLVVWMMLLSSPVYGQTLNVWDGGKGKWSQSQNWSLDTIPDASHDVVFPDSSTNEVELDGNAHVNSLVQKAGKIVLDKTSNNDKILRVDSHLKLKNSSEFNFSNRNRDIFNKIEVGGDFVVDTSVIFRKGRGLKLELFGNSPQKVTPNIASMDTLILSGGGRKILQGNLIVNSQLVMIDGDINTNGNTLTLGTGTSQPGQLTYTSGSVLGTFKRWIENGRSALFLPVGNIDPGDNTKSHHRPVQIDFSANTPTSGGTLSLEFVPQHPTYDGLPLLEAGETDSLFNIGTTGYWSFQAADGMGSDNYQYNIELTAADFVDVFDSTDTHTVIRTDSTQPWGFRGNHAASSAVDGNLVIRRNNLTGFSDFTAAGHEGNPLPVEFTGARIRPSHTGETAIIEWTTATETQNYRFYIDRAYLYGPGEGPAGADTSWTQIGYEEGQGTTSESHSYRFEDSGLDKAGTYVYRIRQVDYDGTEEVLTTLELMSETPSKTVLEENYPNPFNPATNIPYQLAEEGRVSIKVYNALGQQVGTLVDKRQQAGKYKVRFNATSLSGGVYFIRFMANGHHFNKKITLIK